MEPVIQTCKLKWCPIWSKIHSPLFTRCHRTWTLRSQMWKILLQINFTITCPSRMKLKSKKLKLKGLRRLSRMLRGRLASTPTLVTIYLKMTNSKILTRITMKRRRLWATNELNNKARRLCCHHLSRTMQSPKKLSRAPLLVWECQSKTLLTAIDKSTWSTPKTMLSSIFKLAYLP